MMTGFMPGGCVNELCRTQNFADVAVAIPSKTFGLTERWSIAVALIPIMLVEHWHMERYIAPIACSRRAYAEILELDASLRLRRRRECAGTCETAVPRLCKVSVILPLMLVIWSPEEIQALSGRNGYFPVRS